MHVKMHDPSMTLLQSDMHLKTNYMYAYDYEWMHAHENSKCYAFENCIHDSMNV